MIAQTSWILLILFIPPKSFKFSDNGRDEDDKWCGSTWLLPVSEYSDGFNHITVYSHCVSEYSDGFKKLRNNVWRMYLQPDTTKYLTKQTHCDEWTVRTEIIDIDLIVTGSEAHISHKASRGGGNLWIGEVY